MNIDIFLQARLGSTRLPGKVLMRICGKSVIELIIERLRQVPGIRQVILVTGPQEKNDDLAREVNRLGIQCFFGSEDNLLDRFYQASKKFIPDVMVRVTGDCPLIDSVVIAKGIELLEIGKYDAVSNVRKRTYPDGLDFEIFKTPVLEQAWRDLKGESPWPTKYLLESKKFANYDMVYHRDLSSIRLTLDYPEDLHLIEEIYKGLYKERSYFWLEDITKFLEQYPRLLDINKKYIQLDYGIKPESL